MQFFRVSGIVLGTALVSTAGASVPEGLAPSEWNGILAAREAARREVRAVEAAGHQAWNPGQRWRTTFDGCGFHVAPDGSTEGRTWSWGIELVSYGLEGRERTVSLPAAAIASGERMSYEWDGTLTEWFINDHRGLEHGYTLHQRPELRAGRESASGATMASHAGRTSELLIFNLAVRGSLAPRISASRRDVTFVDASGAATVNYNNLTVFDSNGTIMPAWFELCEANAPIDRASIRIVIDDSSAVYPLTIDPIAQQAYLKASNTGADDRFGGSVAISGNTVVVGAAQEDSNATGVNGNQANNTATDSGAAYIFVRNANGVWSQQAYLKASNTGADDYFGTSVAISGETVVVGALFEDSNATGVNGDGANNGAVNAGAAYVFVRSGTVWSQQAYLKASNTGATDFYGNSVAISGNTVVVGSRQEDSTATGVNGNQASNGATNAGAAYVYVRSGSVWSQQAYLKASNTDAEDIFGHCVAVSGNTVVVGAPNEASNATGINGNQADDSASVAGAAYIFVRVGTVWSQQAYLKASNAAANAWFGYSAAASGNTVVIGAAYEDSMAQNSGAAYVFARNGSTWTQQAYLKASNPGFLDFFAAAVAVSGDTVVVGADLEDSNATGVNGNQSSNSAVDSGAAYIFRRIGSEWTQESYLKASNTGAGDEFGRGVAVSGDTVVIGAGHEDSSATGVNGNQASNSVVDSGAAYTFLAPECPGDRNGDGIVDGADLAIVLGSWGACVFCPGDINANGVVDGADLAVVLGAWGACP